MQQPHAAQQSAPQPSVVVGAAPHTTEGFYRAAGGASAPPEAAAAPHLAVPQNGTVQPQPAQQPTAAAHAAPTLAAAPAPAGPTPALVAPVPALAGTKRPYEGAGAPSTGADGYQQAAGPYTADGSGSDAKRQHLDQPAGGLPPAASIPRETVYRIVLDVVDTALIIGRGGNTVRQIEQATGGRVKRLQEPPGARQQVVVIWTNSRETPSPGRMTRNTAQEALLDCVRRVVFQENAPMGQPMSVRMLINRSQERGVMDNMNAIAADNPGITLELRRHQDLPACALDNDVLVELSGEKYSLMAAVEALSHVLREHPILERPGGAPPALRALAGPPPVAAGGGYGAPPYAGYRGY